MPNMRMTKNPMPSQDPNVRNKNFKEVTLGYTEEMALDEAQRCLNCKNMPCVSGCPVNIHIPEFIKKVAEHDAAEAAYAAILAARGDGGLNLPGVNEALRADLLTGQTPQKS